jgi:choline dehydrogenase-like flavoprotein
VSAQNDRTEFDAIVVGSGPGGATVARELSRRGKRVLILERGGNQPLRESFLTLASLMRPVSVGPRLAMNRAVTTGGTSSVYFAVAHVPPLDLFGSLGIDLCDAVEEVKRELPLSVLPDEVVGAQTKRARASALKLGYPWIKRMMLVDVARCPSGYAFESKWNARRFVSEAIANGATLVNRARVRKVLMDRNQAVGVEYAIENGKKESEPRTVHGAKIILAAGGTSSPVILRNSGMRNVADRGFVCHPTVAVFGTIPDMKAGETFPGCEGADLEDDISVGDANLGRTFYRMFMLGNRKLLRMFQYRKSIALGVMVRDSLGGSLRDDNRYHKELTKDDVARLDKGEQIARRIMAEAGAKDVFSTPRGAGHVGGTIRIGEHVDANLETQWRNLHVCDGSVIPETLKISPALPLVCLGKYLAARLAPAV